MWFTLSVRWWVCLQAGGSKRPTWLCHTMIFLSAAVGEQMYDWKCPSVRPSGRPSVRLSGIFDYVPGVWSSWNCYGGCILVKVTSGHSFRGWRIWPLTGTVEKLGIFGHFFVLLRTPPTNLIGECWNCTGMYLVTMRKNVMRRNFEFLHSRSNIGRPRSDLEFSNSSYKFNSRVLKLLSHVPSDHRQKRNAAEFWFYVLNVRYQPSKVKLGIFINIFVLLRTPPTILIGECWNCTGMYLVTMRKNVMRRNFEFLPSRSNIGRPRSDLAFSYFYELLLQFW